MEMVTMARGAAWFNNEQVVNGPVYVILSSLKNMVNNGIMFNVADGCTQTQIHSTAYFKMILKLTCLIHQSEEYAPVVAELPLL
jgi:hypothetical protein